MTEYKTKIKKHILILNVGHFIKKGFHNIIVCSFEVLL